MCFNTIFHLLQKDLQTKGSLKGLYPKDRLAIHLPLSLRLEVGVFSPKFDKVNFHPKAVKELKNLDRQIIRIIQRDVQEKLAVDPKKYGEPLRAPLTGCYKLKYKSLNLRLVYTIRDEQLTIINISDDQEIQQEIEGIVSILAIGERTRERVYKDALNRKEK